MPQQQISLEGIPKPVARAIEVVVQMARRLATTESQSQVMSEPLCELPKWKGTVIGNLSRSEIYDDI